MKHWKSSLVALLALCACLTFAACNTSDGLTDDDDLDEGEETRNDCEHEYETQVTTPTCTEDGYTTYTCKSCGDTYKDDEVPAAHDYEKTIHEPTCSAAGYTEYACKVCKHTYQDNEVEALAHQYEHVTVDPTCANMGYTEHTCKVCGDNYKDNETPTVDHTYTDTVVEPTCTSRGYTTHTCEYCKTSYKDAEKDPLGHSLVLESASKYPTVSKNGIYNAGCTRCDYSKLQGVKYSDVFTGSIATTTTPVAIGVDVSYWQNDQYNLTPINFQAMKNAGIDFVIIRVGYGENLYDPAFEMNYRDAKAAGLDVGVYFYTLATDVAGAQADAYRVLNWIKGKQFEYPIYYDLEDKVQQNLGHDTIKAMTNAFFEIMQSEGYYTALYIGSHFLDGGAVDKAYNIANYDIWYARYFNAYMGGYPWGSNATMPTWNTASYGMPYSIWQFTSEANIPGVTNTSGVMRNLDANVCYKDYPSIMTKYGLNGFQIEGTTVGGDTNPGGSTGGNTSSPDNKEYVWIVATTSLNVRSSPDFMSTTNKIGVAFNGEKYEVLEKNAAYTKILFNGQEAYISAKPEYVSFTQP